MSAVGGIIYELARLFNDAEPGFEYIRIEQQDWLEYFNDAQRQIYADRPELFSENETINLVPGSHQNLPDGCALQKVTSSTGKDQRTRKISDVMLQAFSGVNCKPSCLCDPADYTVSGFSYNPEDPTHFFVDPPVPNDGVVHQADITCLQAPPEVTATGTKPNLTYSPDVIKVPTKLHNAVVEWMLYRAFSVDMESAQSYERMQFHLKHFYEILGAEQKAEAVMAQFQDGRSALNGV